MKVVVVQTAAAAVLYVMVVVVVTIEVGNICLIHGWVAWWCWEMGVAVGRGRECR